MIVLKNNIIFIHRNKCGGMSLREFFHTSKLAVDDYRENNHKSQIKVKYFEGVHNLSHSVPVEKTHKWISVTREPVSWYKSFFYFHMQKKPQRSTNSYVHPESRLFSAFIEGYNDGGSFDTFVNYFVKHNWPAFSNHYDFFNAKADYILNLENLNLELAEVLKKEYGSDFGCKHSIKTVNATQHKKHNLDINISQASIDNIKVLESKWYKDGQYINKINS